MSPFRAEDFRPIIPAVPTFPLAPLRMKPLKYLAGYPVHLQTRVQELITQGRLGTLLADKYGQPHAVRNDGQLYDYVQALKERHLKKSVPLGKVIYDTKLQVLKHALGTHTTISRVHGNRLKASREIRIASVFRDAPAEFLRMIVVHELAHLKEAEHNKAFYQLCTHIEPGYHQLEFDLRLYLTHLELAGPHDQSAQGLTLPE
jgi:predicted metal-dependent hydrolase